MDEIKITRSMIVADKNEGLSPKDIRNKYGLSVKQYTEMIDALDLKHFRRSANKKNFKFIDDRNNSVGSEDSMNYNIVSENQVEMQLVDESSNEQSYLDSLD